MTVTEAIKERRAYRSLEAVEITEETVKQLAESAKLACSCYNNQPWKFIFIYGRDKLEDMYSTLSKGNRWAMNSSMIIAVFSKKDSDCVVKNREYYLFDTGMAVGFMLLKATELGLVAHPIAGYKEEKVKELLNIPEEMKIITLIIVGKHADDIKPELSEDQALTEKERPPRKSFDEFAWIDEYKN